MIVRFIVYGMGREKVTNLVRGAAPPGTIVDALSDYQAATDIKSGKADVAIGVCQSGSGGALAIPRALLGADACASLSTPSRRPTSEDIRSAVLQNKKVFGFALAHVDAAVPELVGALNSRSTGGETEASAATGESNKADQSEAR